MKINNISQCNVHKELTVNQKLRCISNMRAYLDYVYEKNKATIGLCVMFKRMYKNIAIFADMAYIKRRMKVMFPEMHEGIIIRQFRRGNDPYAWNIDTRSGYTSRVKFLDKLERDILACSN